MISDKPLAVPDVQNGSFLDCHSIKSGYPRFEITGLRDRKVV